MPVDFERDDSRPHVGRLSIDLGPLNLLTTHRIEELADAFRSVPSDVAVLAVVGDGDGLCAGIDLKWARDLSPHEGWDLLSALYGMIQTVRDLDAVTVCGAGGYALGGGFELAIACDFRVSTTEAALGLPEVTVGLPTVIQGGLLPTLVGDQTAKELIYLGEPITGERAAELGLVNRAVPESAYDSAVSELIDAVAAKSPTVLTWQKRAFRAWRSHGLEAGMARSIGLGAQCFGTPDQREAMAAFLDGRDPAFGGQRETGKN